MYSTVLCDIIRYLIAFFRIILYHFVLDRVISYCIVWYPIILYCIVSFHRVSYCTYCMVLYCIASCHFVWYHIVSFFLTDGIILSCIILYHCVLYSIVSHGNASHRIASHCVASYGIIPFRDVMEGQGTRTGIGTVIQPGASTQRPLRFCHSSRTFQRSFLFPVRAAQLATSFPRRWGVERGEERIVAIRRRRWR